MRKLRRIWSAGLLGLFLSLTILALSTAKDDDFREVYRDNQVIWSFSPVSVILKNEATGCDPYYELQLKIVEQDRGYYDLIRVQVKKDAREYKFTDSIGYDPAGQVAEA
ncbi:MAG: hypothetical protein P4N59_00140 [Negativicutes bacterium]|nr:hypothetical protein [Negativicutes bacterium]